MFEDFLSYLKEYDKNSPLVSSLKLSYKLGLISASDLMNLTKAFGIPMEAITSTVKAFGEEFIEPLFIVSYVKHHTALMVLTNGKVYDGKVYPITIISPAQFLNLLAKLRLPPAFSVYPYQLDDFTRLCIKVAINHNIIYQIYTKGLDKGFVVRTPCDMSNYLKFFIMNQLKVVKTPLERKLLEEKLKEYANADESKWYIYPFVKVNNVDIDPKIATEIAKKVLLPVQVVKRVIQFKDNSEDLSKVRFQFGLTEDQVKKIIDLYNQLKGDGQ